MNLSSLSRRGATVVGLVVLALTVSGCPEKKTEQPKSATPVAEAPKPPPTPVVEEQRAVKECAAPIDLAPAAEVKIGARSAQASGYKLAFTDKDADGAVSFGVLGPMNEDSGLNMVALKKYVKFFQDEKVDAILVTGDVGEVADGIARVLKVLAETKLPVLAVVGNRECRAEFTDGVASAQKDFSNIVNLNQVRAVEFPELTLVSLPGYHDPNYISCATGCRYFKSTIDEVARVAKEAKTPVLLVSHGPPHGSSKESLDYASAGGNVGDEEINRAIKDGNIAFGAFSNIKEGGARATADAAGTQLVKADVWAKTLYMNPGPADTFGWEMNDGTTSNGMAAVLTFKDGQARYRLYRNKAPTPAEKAEAAKLEPPARGKVEEKTEAPPAPPAPSPGGAAAPPPGQPGK